MAIKTVVEMKQDRASLLQEAEMILDAVDSADRAMTPDEQSKYDAAVMRVGEMNVDIDRRMQLEKVAAPTFDQKPAVRTQPSAEIDTVDRVQATIVPTDFGPRIEMPRAYSKLIAFPSNAAGNTAAYR